MSDRKVVRVKNVMKTGFDLVDGMTTIQEVLDRMKHVETKCVIIDKRHENDEYGILLISDIAKEVLAKDRAPERVNVYEVMSKPVITVDGDMDIRYCARLFDKFGLSRTPVIENGKVIGIVSFTDMVLQGMVNGGSAS